MISGRKGVLLLRQEIQGQAKFRQTDGQLEPQVPHRRHAAESTLDSLIGDVLLELAGPVGEGRGAVPRRRLITQDIKKILTAETNKYPWFVEVYSVKRLFQFRFENLTEFRDFLYIFLHVKTKIDEIPLFIPNEYVRETNGSSTRSWSCP